MTNYRIGSHRTTSALIGPDSDLIDQQKMDRGIKLQFHCMNIGRTIYGSLIWLQTYKPSRWTQTRIMLKQRMQWRLTHLPELVEKLRGLVME